VDWFCSGYRYVGRKSLANARMETHMKGALVEDLSSKTSAKGSSGLEVVSVARFA
jgi:hypothetical protein